MTENLRDDPTQYSGFSSILTEFADGQLMLNRVQEKVHAHARVETDPNTWMSMTRRNDDGSIAISIGEQELPPETLKRWQWGARGAEAQFVIKVSHEYAHVVQREFDGELLPYLDSQDRASVPESAYIRLYLALEAAGQLSGLASERIYHAQSQHTGNLQMPIYEDMAELLGARMLGEQYFDFRMQNAGVSLPSDIKEGIRALVESVIEKYLKK